MAVTMRKHALSAALAALALAGCKERKERSEAESPAPAAEKEQVTEPEPREIEWIQDDYPAALKQAKEKGKPLVIDMWAPWCHTCVSMKHYVLSDPGLTPMADRFVWVALDTDKEKNADAVGRFKVGMWPTFYVVSPENETVQSRHLGAASVAQLREFLIQGEKGHLEVTAEAGKLARNSLLWHVRAGDRAAAEGKPKEAAEAYQLAFEAAPETYEGLSDLMVSIVSSLYEAGQFEQCAQFAMDHTERAEAGNTAAIADFAYYAVGCAKQLEDDELVSVLLDSLHGAIDRVLGAEDAALSMDDRSYALETQRHLALERGEDEEAKELAEKQRALVDRAFEEAPSAHAAMTYAWHLAEVHVYLGEPEKVVPRLEQLAKKLPEEYEPPHRLAWVYYQMGEHEKALGTAKKALERAYGPRAIRVQKLIADIHAAAKDREAEIAMRKAIIDAYEALPEAHEDEDGLAAAKQKLAELAKK